MRWIKSRHLTPASVTPSQTRHGTPSRCVSMSVLVMSNSMATLLAHEPLPQLVFIQRLGTRRAQRWIERDPPAPVPAADMLRTPAPGALQRTRLGPSHAAL